MSSFVSLTSALEAWFDTPLSDLPDAVRQRVDRDFFPMPWDSLAPDQRRKIASQWDYRHDPATERDRRFWWDFYARMGGLKTQIEEWNAAATPTAGDLAQKEARLAELEKELARMQQQEQQAQSDSRQEQNRIDDAEVDTSATPDILARYVAYPKAMKLLEERLEATQEELAAWVWMGPKDGGIAAYTNANELTPPPRFYFDNFMCEDYLSPLMACWFQEDEIACFDPTDRYITGMALIERWGNIPGIKPEAFIRAKIAESRLLDAHPTFGCTQGTCPENASWPPLASGLFVLAHVEAIEAEDFGEDQDDQDVSVSSPCQPVSASQIKQYFCVLPHADANDKWWSEKMRDAKRYGLAECRVGAGKKGPGGSLWRPDLVAAWLLDRHSRGVDGLSASPARAALKKFPGCEEVAEDLFPPDE